jgi:hypothetical protein
MKSKDELTESIGRSVKQLLERSQEEIVQVALMAIISKGVTVSIILDAIANICDERGYKEPVGLIEKAVELIKEDEPQIGESDNE